MPEGRSIAVALALAACVAVCGCATRAARPAANDDAGARRAETVITAPLLSAPIRFLADDALEGRGPGSRGDVLARLYLASTFEMLGLAPPFADGSFERVHAGHFYGHLDAEQRRAFLAAAARLAPELVVVDSALRSDGEPEAWQERTLNDGSRHRVYKRWFTADSLAAELGGGETVHAGPWFVAVRR